VKPTPFTIAIPDDQLEDMRRRLANTRWPGDLGNDDWHYGVEQGWLRDMVAYWAQDYDWRQHEARMNAVGQYRVEIDGVTVHFMHVKSGRPDAIPLLLTHGWPWSFWDWYPIMSELTTGGDDQPAFDVVVPSLPGFGFSSLATTGVDIRGVARRWVTLMTDVLGYERFAAAGGDLGAAVTSELGHAYPDRLLAVHITTVLLHGLNFRQLTDSDFAPDEQWMIPVNRAAPPRVTSHMVIHSTEPQTLAYGLTDSPAGTAAWLWSKRRLWSQGDVMVTHGRDFLCTLASIYWLTNTLGSSLRIYREQFGGGVAQNGLPAPLGWQLLHDRRPSIPVPTGVAVAPQEVALIPRATVADRVNLQRWTVLPRGGHFVPTEAPELLTHEYREFFGKHARRGSR
jgi:pimeloyl-ACP methyl ester carboxylesterase